MNYLMSETNSIFSGQEATYDDNSIRYSMLASKNADEATSVMFRAWFG